MDKCSVDTTSNIWAPDGSMVRSKTCTETKKGSCIVEELVPKISWLGGFPVYIHAGLWATQCPTSVPLHFHMPLSPRGGSRARVAPVVQDKEAGMYDR